MGKKDSAIAFLNDASSGNVREAFRKYVHPEFIHHNIYFKGDRESLLAAMEENALQFPDKSYETILALEEKEYVAIHGKVVLTPKVYGVIHLFRFEQDKIIESWEASQEELGNSPNENGLF